MIITAALWLVFAQESSDDDLDRARARLGELARLVEAARGEADAAREAVRAFSRGTCVACPKTHATCETRETCEPACEKRLSELADAFRASRTRLREREAERDAVRQAWRRRVAEIELELGRIHDRIGIYLDAQKRLRDVRGGLAEEAAEWRSARMRALVDGLDHLKTALRDRFKVLSKAKGDPGVRVEAVWRAFDKAREAWTALAAAADAPSRAVAFERAVDGAQALRQAVLDACAAMSPAAAKELQLVAYSLGAVVDGVQAIAVWERDGWAKAAPLVRKTLDSVRGAVGSASAYYKPLAIAVTAEELIEDAAGAVLAQRALSTFTWALDLNEKHEADVQARLAELGRAYEAGEARRKRIREMLR